MKKIAKELMNEKENAVPELEQLLQSSAVVPEPSESVLSRARSALVAAAELPTDGRTAPEAEPAPRRRRPGRRGLLLAAAAAVLVGGVALPIVRPFGGDPASSAAADVLRRAGQAAGRQATGDSQAPYWHSVSLTQNSPAEKAQRREIWIGHRSPGVLRDVAVDGTPTLTWIGVGVFPTGGTAVSWDELLALPTDPDALERRLRGGIHGAGPDDDTELFVIVGDLLRESPAPPALRRALFEVAAQVPGVRLVTWPPDAAGRQGVAVARGDQVYVIDPEDGRLLEESQGAYRATYLEQGPVDSAPTPTGAAPAPGPPPAPGPAPAPGSGDTVVSGDPVPAVATASAG